MKAVKAELSKSNPDAVDAFEKGAQLFAKKVIANFKDFEFASVSVVSIGHDVDVPLSVHRGIDESRWHGCSSQLPGTYAQYPLSFSGN